jgi:hypothetical protein
MKSNVISLYNQNVTNYNPTFSGAKSRKLIAKIESATLLKKVEITFDELERMYNEIGYDVLKKPGSHAIVCISETIHIPVIIPHNNKYVHINDLKRFLLVKEGKFVEASQVGRGLK